MEVSNIKQALRVNRMKSAKAMINFADISTFDIVPTPPKEPKPETTKMLRHRGVRAQKFKIYQAKPAQEPGFEHNTDNRMINHIDMSRTVPKDSYSPQNPTKYAYNDVKTPFPDKKANESLNIAVKNINPIRYPAPGPREQLAPSPFPVNKNRLAPVVDPRKNAVPKTPRPGPIKDLHTTIDSKGMESTVVDRPSMTLLPEAIYNPNPIRYPAPGPRELLAPSPFPIDKNRLAPVVNPKKNAVPKTTRMGPRPLKAVHMPIFSDNTESSCILTQMFSARDDYVPDHVVPVMENSRPIRYPSPGPRDQLLPSPFPVNKTCLPPLVKHGRVIAPMCG